MTEYDLDLADIGADSSVEAAKPEPRVFVWACPERPGPPLYRSDLVDGHHRNYSYGWTWWSAQHIVALPAGMSFYDALCSKEPVEVTITYDVASLESGLNEMRQRYDTDWSTTKPEQRLLDAGDLCQPVGTLDEHYFRKMRDIERRTDGLPRAVVRSDDYGRAPHYLLRHNWADGTFTQGGKVTRDEMQMVFIEAFPRNPDTYIRGEGITYADAEDALWARMIRYRDCPSPGGTHRWETRGYRNGAGFCGDCGLFKSHVFDLAEIGSVCVVCKTATYYTTVTKRNPDDTWQRGVDADLLCEEHSYPSVHELSEQIWAHNADPSQPVPDLSWMAHRLPEGVPVAELLSSNFYDAHKHAVRDALDVLLGAQES